MRLFLYNCIIFILLPIMVIRLFFKNLKRKKFIIKLKSLKYSKSNKVSLASKRDVQAVANLCIEKLDKKNFFKPIEKKAIMLENLRSIFYKMELSKKETRILSSVFASLAKKG